MTALEVPMQTGPARRPPAGAAVVFLDFGGTLDADGVPWSAQFFGAYRRASGSLPLAAFESTFRKSDEVLAALAAIRDLGFRATIERQGKLLSDLLPDDPVDFPAVAREVYEGAVVTLARNRGVLEALRAAGHRLGVVSNFSGNLDRCLAEVGFAEFFDVVLDSAVVGWSKPDRRIFLAALERVGMTDKVDPCWMVGDNPEADIRGAAALGLHTCWLAPLERQPPRDVRPDIRIDTFTQLPAALSRHARTDSRGR